MPSGGTASPSSVVRVSASQTALVGVVVAQPPRLAQHRRGGTLPVGAAVGVLGAGQRQRPLVGLELLRLVQPALDGLL